MFVLRRNERLGGGDFWREWRALVGGSEAGVGGVDGKVGLEGGRSIDEDVIENEEKDAVCL